MDLAAKSKIQLGFAYSMQAVYFVTILPILKATLSYCFPSLVTQAFVLTGLLAFQQDPVVQGMNCLFACLSVCVGLCLCLSDVCVCDRVSAS